MNRVYHEKTCYSDYSKPLPSPQKKGQGGMKKGQGGRSGSPSTNRSNRYYYQTNAKTLNPLSKRF